MPINNNLLTLRSIFDSCSSKLYSSYLRVFQSAFSENDMTDLTTLKDERNARYTDFLTLFCYFLLIPYVTCQFRNEQYNVNDKLLNSNNAQCSLAVLVRWLIGALWHLGYLTTWYFHFQPQRINTSVLPYSDTDSGRGDSDVDAGCQQASAGDSEGENDWQNCSVFMSRKFLARWGV